MFPVVALANPSGATIVNGIVSFNQPDTSTLNITNSPGAIINWQQFNIGTNEITRFIQQNSTSAVLNHITSQNPSEILGTLSSNGRVFLINSNGIVFGKNSMIDTAGFVASTLNISNEDFLNNRLHFEDLANNAEILNQGFIHTSNDGEVILVAPHVSNEGAISVDQGKLLLAAGQSVTIDSLNYDNIEFEVQAPANNVVNIGKLMSDGGSIGVFAGSIQNSGTVSANAITVDDAGTIRLVAQGDNTQNDATIQATSDTGNGGHIEILGDRVGLFGATTVDVSGDSGGGEALVGGDYQGSGDTRTASTTQVSRESTIRADATGSGNGGKAIVWADDFTLFYGKATALGGSVAGNGGFIEVSGKNTLNFDGLVDTRADMGTTGTVLFDPHNISVFSSAAGTYIPGTDDTFAANPGSDVTFTNASIEAALNANNVILQANNDINWTGPLAPTSSFDLTLQAGRSIIISDTTGGVLSTNGGNLTLIANSTAADGVVDAQRDVGAANILIGDGVMSSSINTNGGNLTMEIRDGAGLTNNTAGQIVVENLGTLTSAGGTIDLSAPEVNLIAGSSVNAGSGIVKLHPYVNGTPIQLAGADPGASTLHLSTIELGAITAANTIIGNINSGITTIAGSFTLPGTMTLGGPNVSWNTGTVITGAGNILELASGSTLEISGTGSHIFSNLTFNNNGTVNYNTATTGFDLNDGTVFNNNGLFDIKTDVNIASNSGTGTFNNNAGAILRKSGGTGTSSIASTVGFNNSDATIDIATGNIQLLDTATFSNATTITGNALILNGTHTLGAGSSIAGTINLIGGSLATAGAATLDNLNFSGGTITNNNDITVNGTLAWDGGNLTGSGSTTISALGTLLLTGGGTSILDGHTLINNSFSTFNAWTSTTNNFFLQNSATFTNNGVFKISTNSRSFNNGAGTNVVNNNGTLDISVGANTATINTIFNNSGTVNVQNGKLSLAGSGSGTTGQYNVNGTLEFSGGTHTLTDSTFIGTGTTDITAGIVNLNGTTSATAGTLQLTLGSLNISSSASLNNLTLAGGVLTNNGSTSVNGSFLWSGGTLTGTGTTTVNSTGNLQVTGVASSTLDGHSLINNSASASNGWTSTVSNWFFQNGASFTNNGVFNILTNSRTIFSAGADSITNTGTMNVATGANTATINTAFNNSGTLNIQNGTLALAGGGTGTSGQYVVNGTLDFTGGTHTLSNSLISGTGTTDVIAGIVTLDGTTTASGGTLSLSGGTGALNINSTANINNLTLTAGTLTNTGSTTVNGLFNWSGGTLAGAGSTTISSLGKIQVTGVNPTTIDAQTLKNDSSDASNGWSSTVSNWFFQNGASFINNGVFNITTNTRSIFSTGADSITNNGILNFNIGANTVTVNPVFANNGTLNLQSGTFNIGVKTLDLPVNSVLMGSGTFTGNITNTGGTIMPGGTDNIGTLTITGNYSQSAGSIDIELQSGNVNPLLSVNDKLAISGQADFTGGSIKLLGLGLQKVIGDTFSVVSYGSLLGSTITINPYSKETYTTSFNANDLTLTMLTLGTFGWDGGAGDGLWTSPLNWDTNLLPTATDEAAIGAFDVNVNGSATALNLSLDAAGSLTISAGGSLALASSSILNGTLNIVDGNLINGGNTVLNGAFNWSGLGSILGTGTFTTNGLSTISGAGSRVLANNWLNAATGEIDWLAGSIQMDASSFTNDGTMNANGGTGFSSGSGSSTIVNSATGTMNINNDLATGSSIQFDNDGDINITGSLLTVNSALNQNSGSLNLFDGTLTTPTLTIAGGALTGAGTINGDVINDGLLSPGNPIGVLRINGNLTLLANSVLNLDITGTQTAGVDFDVLDVSGQIIFGGTLALLVPDSVTTPLQGSFAPLTFASSTGQFLNLTATTGYAFKSSFDPTMLTLAINLPADLVVPDPAGYIVNLNNNFLMLDDNLRSQDDEEEDKDRAATLVCT